MRRLFRVT